MPSGIFIKMMNIRQPSIGFVVLIGLLIWGFNLIILKILTIILVGTAGRLALKNIPWIEVVTTLTVYTGHSFGSLAGAYVGFSCMFLSDVIWYDFSNTIWNPPAFAVVGMLSGMINLDFIILVGLMTLVYNIIANTIFTIMYGVNPIGSIMWTIAHIFANVTVAGYLEPQLIAYIKL